MGRTDEMIVRGNQTADEVNDICDIALEAINMAEELQDENDKLRREVKALRSCIGLLAEFC